jgi:hypothetical protein
LEANVTLRTVPIEQTRSRTLNASQAHTTAALKQIGEPFSNGVWIRNLAMTSAVGVDIPHGLGHKHNGWWMTRANGAYQVLTEDFTKATDKTLHITAHVGGYIDLWVF